MITKSNQALRDYTSLKVGGPAEKLLTLEPGDSLLKTVNELNDHGPIWVLGFGTNCLVSDQGLPGTVILNRIGRIEQLSPTKLKATSGVDWDNLVQKAISLELFGLEFTSGIPGGVGAAIAGNIAAYGHKVADRFVEATILNSQTGAVEMWDKHDLEFNYRSSALQKPGHEHFVVLDATFEFSTSATGQLEYESALKVAKELGIKPDNLKNRRRIIMETRKRAGSLLQNSVIGPWTAGSFFKNPVVNEDQVQAIIDHEETDITRDQLLRQNVIHSGNSVRVSAAHVLLASGFKRGQTWGNVRLHSDHILKVENAGQATAQEIYNVVQEILKTVKQNLDIDLEPEVRILGEFT